jgi:hypothetical protein
MSYKVFLFENIQWLYCENVTLKDGVYKGHVINGLWYMKADTINNTIDTSIDILESKLIWACDPGKGFDYTTVINDARERYAAGEPANYELKPEPVYEDDDDDEIPF